MDKRPKSQLNICKGDSVNLQILDKQFQSAAESETKYWQQNDAKFRALAQKVPTYEDFKEIVAASHLRPLDPKERIDFLSTEQQQQQQTLDKRHFAPWNQFSNPDGPKSQDRNSQSSHGFLRNDFAAFQPPADDIQFQKQWKSLQTALKETSTESDSADMHATRLRYLRHVGTERMRQIWRVEVGNFGEIVETLDRTISSSACPPPAAPSPPPPSEQSTTSIDASSSSFSSRGAEISDENEEKLALVCEIFEAMKSSKRFLLSTQFLGPAEKEALERVAAAVESRQPKLVT